MLKAQRIKLQDHIIRATDIQNALFPNGKLQERTAHFSAVVGALSIDAFTCALKMALLDAEGLQIVQ